MPNANELGHLNDNLAYSIDGATIFNGQSGSYQDAGHHASMSLANATVSMGFTLDKLFGTMTLVSKDASGNGEGEFTIWVKDGQLIVTMEDGSESEWLKVPELILDDNQTYHLAVSFGDDGLMVWLDGELVAAEPEFKVGLDANDNSLVIGGTRAWTGAGNDAHSLVEGTISDVMIFDYQLGQRDVVTLTEATDPALGDAAAMQAAMADLAPAFLQLHHASDTLKAILAEYGVDHHGHMSTMLDMRAAGWANNDLTGNAMANGINGGGGNDMIKGMAGDDVLQGGYGNDKVLGGAGNDILDGGFGEDKLFGGAGNDLLLSRADGGEPMIAYDPNRDEGDPNNELTNGKLYPVQPIPGDDTLTGGAGADIFYFQTLINAKDYLIEKHTREDGTINWHGVAGENDNLHDHWVDMIGNDVVTDFSRAEGDRIVIEGHTTEIRSITYGDANGDGVMDHSIITLYSDQGAGGGAHNDDDLGTITVFGDLITLADVEQTAAPAYGIIHTVDNLAEAVTPFDLGTDTNQTIVPANLPELQDLALPNGKTPVFASPGEFDFSSDARAPLIFDHTNAMVLRLGTVAFKFEIDALGGTQALFSKDASGHGTGGHLTAYLTEGGQLVVRLQDSDDSFHFEVDGIEVNRKYDFAFSFGNGGAALYLDGVRVAYHSSVRIGLDTNTEALIVGASGWSSSPDDPYDAHNHFNGTINGFTLFGEQLTDDELYGAGPHTGYEYFAGSLGNYAARLDANGDLIVTGNGQSTEIGEGTDYLEFSDLTVRVDDFQFGNAQNETLDGGDASDVIYGRGGNDYLRGRSNDDMLNGGSGNDTLSGGSGHDRLYGEDGEDNIYGGDGNDLLSGGDGDDELKGEAGSDRFYGGLGDDVIYGNNWSEEGNASNDRAYYDGNFADFSFETIQWYNSARGEYMDVLVITDHASGGTDGFYEGEDRLIDIDWLMFADQMVSVETLFN